MRTVDRASAEQGGSIAPQPPLPLYQSLAASIRQLIHNGTIKPGERMTSLREVSQRRGVSLATAVQAYRVLEAQGLIEARPQSGYFVRKEGWLAQIPKAAKPVPKALKVDVSSLVMEMLSAPASPGLIALGTACPGPELYPRVALHRTLARVTRLRAYEIDQYGLGAGNLDLRREIGRRSLDWGLTLSQDELVITNGCMEALNIALRAVAKAGDVVAVETPAYFGFLQIAESMGLKVLHLPCDSATGLDLDALEDVLQRKNGAPRLAALLCCPNISNPSGATMPDESKARLARMAAQYQLPVIEDDLYGDLYFGAKRPKALRAFDQAGWVMLCGSFTKILSPGLRVGWIAGGRFHEQVQLLKFTASISTTALPQLALAEYLAHEPFDKHLRQLRRTLQSNATQARRVIAEHFPAGTRVSNPSGGFVFWVELPAQIDALKLYQAARAEHISIAPGAMFSATGANPQFSHCLRLAFGLKFSARYEQALGRVGALARGQMR